MSAQCDRYQMRHMFASELRSWIRLDKIFVHLRSYDEYLLFVSEARCFKSLSSDGMFIFRIFYDFLTVAEQSCSQTIFYFYLQGRGCSPCQCNTLYSVDNNCNTDTGQCNCLFGVGGLNCDHCINGYDSNSAMSGLHRWHVTKLCWCCEQAPIYVDSYIFHIFMLST